MKILLINNCNEEHPKLNLFLEKFGSVKEIFFDKLGNLKIENIKKEKIDLIVLSGSRFVQLQGNESLYEKEFELIRKTKIPIVGICFGFEIIATCYGEKLEYEEERIRSISEINFKNKNYYVFQSHHFSLKKLKENTELEILSRSVSGIEIIKIKNKNIFGLQFHPEHTDNLNDGEEIFSEILRLVHLS